MHVYIYIYIHTCMYIYIYIYIIDHARVQAPRRRPEILPAIEVRGSYILYIICMFR